jgi:hypothetical protein
MHSFEAGGLFRRVPRQDGWALAEALVATVVLASGAAVMASLFAQATTSVRASRDHSAASRLASQKLEELLGDPIAPPVSPSTSLQVDTPGFFDRLDEAGRLAPDGIYRRRWLIEPLGPAPFSPLRLTVRVWLVAQPGDGRTLAAVRRR